MIKKALLGPILVLFAALCSSTTGTIQVLAPTTAHPITTGFVRMAVGSVVLFIWCFIRGKLTLELKSLPWGKLVLSALALLGCQLCFFIAVLRLGVSVGTTVDLGIVPIAAAIFGFLFFRKRPGPAWYFSTLLAITGVVLMAGSLSLTGRFTELVFPILAGSFYALYVTISPMALEKLEPESATALIFAIIAVLLIPTLFYYPVNWVISSKGILVALGLGVISAALPFSLLLAGLKSTSSTVAATLMLAEPAGAICLGVFLLNEDLSLTSSTGIALVIASIIVLLLFEKEEG